MAISSTTFKIGDKRLEKYRGENASRYKHGMFGTKIYDTWCHMKSRCSYKKNNSFAHYGARGIVVCEKWQTFTGFYEDMGATYKEGNELPSADYKEAMTTPEIEKKKEELLVLVDDYADEVADGVENQSGTSDMVRQRRLDFTFEKIKLLLQEMYEMGQNDGMTREAINCDTHARQAAADMKMRVDEIIDQRICLLGKSLNTVDAMKTLERLAFGRPQISEAVKALSESRALYDLRFIIQSLPITPNETV